MLSSYYFNYVISSDPMNVIRLLHLKTHMPYLSPGTEIVFLFIFSVFLFCFFPKVSMSAGATSMCSAELCLPSWAPSMWCVRCSAPMSVLSNCPWQQWRSCMEWFLKDYRSDQIASLWIAPQNIFQKRSFMFFRTSLLRLVNLLFPVSLLRKILRSAWINYKLIKMNDGMIFMRKKRLLVVSWMVMVMSVLNLLGFRRRPCSSTSERLS